MKASHALYDARIRSAPMRRRNLWLAAPFLVLAIAVTTFTVTPLWIQHRAAELSEPAYAALASSVPALNLVWAGFAAVGGFFAALLVRRHHRLAEEARQRDRERAHELDQFAGRVAHDIVSPLGPVSVGVQYLARKVAGDAEAQDAVRIIRRSLDRVGAIVDELLRFARAGGQPASGECADLPRVIDALRDELSPAARQHGVALTLEPAPAVKVACSEAAILVVLQNLLRNAIKYIGNGPRKLVSARAVVNAGKVRLSVQDTGPGLPSGMERAVFEPYVRGDGTRQPGIGLGLATVKRIVESRRGRVGVCSDPRRGATFWVELPLVAPGAASG